MQLETSPSQNKALQAEQQEEEELPFLQPSFRSVGFSPDLGGNASSRSAIPAVAELLGPSGLPEVAGFEFDIETCRRIFNAYDTNQSGTLDIQELKRLTNVLWETFHPDAAGLDGDAQQFLVQGIIGETDVNNDRQISFDEFIPWYRRMAHKYWLQQKRLQTAPTDVSRQMKDQRRPHEQTMHLLHKQLLLQLNRAPGPDGAAVEQAAQHVLKGSKDIAASLRAASAQGKTASFAFHADDGEYHATMSRILQTGPRPVVSGPRQPERKAWGLEEVSETAVAAVLEAYCNLATVGVEMLPQLVKVKGMAQGLMNAVEQGSADVKVYAVFLLSQLAIAGPETAIKIALMPGLPEACTRAISSSSKSGKLTFNWALLINNVAALGGEDAVRALTAHGMLVRELGAWLDNEHDAATLQRLTGVFNHLSRSVESARALQVHGIMDALRRMVARTSVSGTADAHEAYVGLAHMALANIAVRQGSSTAESGPGGGDGKAEGEGGKMEFEVASIKSIVGFLKCALEERALSGIRFRVYDVLYALASLCKCQERDVLGIECGLVDVAVQVTAEWKPGKYSSIFSDSKASTYPVLELSTDILMHLAHSEACRKRMHELYLESILDRLLLTAEGVVREHVSKVLFVLRDEFQSSCCAGIEDLDYGQTVLLCATAPSQQEAFTLLERQVSSLQDQLLVQQHSISMLTAEKVQLESTLRQRQESAVTSEGLGRSPETRAPEPGWLPRSPSFAMQEASIKTDGGSNQKLANQKLDTVPAGGTESRGTSGCVYADVARVSILSGNSSLAIYLAVGVLVYAFACSIQNPSYAALHRQVEKADSKSDGTWIPLVEFLGTAQTSAYNWRTAWTRGTADVEQGCSSARRSWFSGKMHCLFTGKEHEQQAWTTALAPSAPFSPHTRLADLDENLHGARARPEGSQKRSDESGPSPADQKDQESFLRATSPRFRAQEDLLEQVGSGSCAASSENVLALQKSIESLERDKTELEGRVDGLLAAAHDLQELLRSAEQSLWAGATAVALYVALSITYVMWLHGILGRGGMGLATGALISVFVFAVSQQLLLWATPAYSGPSEGLHSVRRVSARLPAWLSVPEPLSSYLTLDAANSSANASDLSQD